MSGFMGRRPEGGDEINRGHGSMSKARVRAEWFDGLRVQWSAITGESHTG
jgi:hypothetical protein